MVLDCLDHHRMLACGRRYLHPARTAYARVRYIAISRYLI
jgi:hypothetical protein